MKIRKRTPRTQMYEDILILRIGEFYKELANDEGVPDSVLDTQLTQYAILSTRVDTEDDALDFEFALPTDSAETIRSKVVKYLDTQYFDTVEVWRTAVREYDRPANIATAPTPPAETDIKKK